MSEPVVVLGMHRSGTSFLIRALNLSGLWLGADSDLHTVEGRAMPGNPKGNYENRAAIGINNALLARSGGSWVMPPARILAGAEDERRIAELCAALEHDRPPQFPRWGWKDPRTVLTLEVWQRALQRGVFVVASFRHPTAVARSLEARDRIPLQHGYALWAHYNARLLEILDVRPHVLVRFDVDPPALVSQTVRICEQTGLRSDPQAIASWHDPQLVRSRADGEPLPDLPTLEPLWQRLNERYRAQSS